MKVAPGCRPVAVHVPRGADWKIPRSPPGLARPALAPQPVTCPFPAPMSDDTTATWMLGKPSGALSSAVMNVGKLLSRFVCRGVIDDELSTMNKRSTLRLID